MPDRKTADQFVARVIEGAHAEAIEEFYAVNASMQENLGPPRVGRDQLVAHGRLTRIEELAYQRREAEQIAEETFFYDPVQFKPRSQA